LAGGDCDEALEPEGAGLAATVGVAGDELAVGERDGGSVGDGVWPVSELPLDESSELGESSEPSGWAASAEPVGSDVATVADVDSAERSEDSAMASCGDGDSEGAASVTVESR
jgi:hypothetical protein